MKQSPIFTRTYDLLRWLIPLTVKFPRTQRFVLATRVQETALRFQERLIEAGRSQQPAPILAQADTDLVKLRLYMRLCRDLELIKFNQYEHGQRLVDEIGRLAGEGRSICTGQTAALTVPPYGGAGPTRAARTGTTITRTTSTTTTGFGWSSMTLGTGPVNPVVHGRGAAPEMNESQPGPAPVAPGFVGPAKYRRPAPSSRGRSCTCPRPLARGTCSGACSSDFSR